MSSLTLQAGNITLPPVPRHQLPPALRKTFTKKEELDAAFIKIAALAGASHTVEQDNLGSKIGANAGLWKCTAEGCRFQALASRNWTSNCWEITKLLHVDHGDPSILNPPPSAMSNPSVSPNPKRTSSIFRTSSRASLSPSVTGSTSIDFGSSSIHAFLLKAFEGHPNVVGSVGKYTEVFVKEKADDIEQILGLEEDALKGFCENGLSPAIPAWPRYQILSELLKMKRARGANGNSKAEESF